MRKLKLAMAGVLCGGLLLMGIGTGVMFLDFSALSYGGEKLPEQVETKTASFSVEMQETGTYGLDLINSHRATVTDITVETDSAVPKGSIQVEVDYGSLSLTPRLWVEPIDNGKYQYQVGMSWNGWDNGMAFFMACKDQLLAELKEGKISSYQSLQVQRIAVTVHPDETQRVEFMSGMGGVDYHE